MSIEDRLNQEAEWWMPEPGDMLVGTVADLATRDGDYGEYPVVTVLTDDGTYVDVSGMRSVLRDHIHQAELQIGDKVGFKYDGEKESKKGNKYHSYRVVSESGPNHTVGSTAGASAVTAPAATPTTTTTEAMF